MKKLVIGILAHVDAGKTTLAESMLYLAGSIRTLGRVDHKDAFLDTHELERERGITIFSKQAVFSFQNMEVTLLDTPGHVDFSTEMERTLQVLDYGVLVISGSDGIQGHTETLWKLLEKYKIPVFLFVNKMDLNGTDSEKLMEEIKNRLDDRCVDFGKRCQSEEFMETAAMCDEALLEYYLEKGTISKKELSVSVADRKVIPCFFGSALKLDGVDAFLEGLDEFTEPLSYSDQFGAKIYKIARDSQGNRLTYMKITGGSLKVKMPLTGNTKNLLGEKEEIWEEKADQIRIYSGAKYRTIEEVTAGTVCAVTGLTKTYPGQGIGMEPGSELPVLKPVLNYQVILPSGCDPHSMLTKLRQLEEEDPQLHIIWSEPLKEIHVQLMGEVQVEILKSLIWDRFRILVEFGPGNIVYKETILEPVEGVGHFEPLKHYAEVHLLLEPNMPGAGLEFLSNCSEELLDRNWQRLIITHLEEKEHLGVLTGSPITDLKITLIAGKAHQKHTEGGDFREATYRAVRQGLKKAKSVLLEPFYEYTLEVPSDMIGRAMSDIQRMNGSFQSPETHGDRSFITGSVPVSSMQGYQQEVMGYTRGRGRLNCNFKGYEPCHNPEEVIKAIGYDCEGDLANPSSSVFCAHGAGFLVEWDKVKDYMHVDSGWKPFEESKQLEPGPVVESSYAERDSWKEDKELEEIFVRTFGPIRKKDEDSRRRFHFEKKPVKKAMSDRKPVQMDWEHKKTSEEYLLVDGYNIIFTWKELSDLADENLDAARNRLMDILCNYQGFKNCILILVFDAYKVKGGTGQVFRYHNIHVVFTKEAETADKYIEKTVHRIARSHQVTVATSDALEQVIILGQGAVRLSANDLKDEIERMKEQIRKEYLEQPLRGRNFLGEQLGEEMQKFCKEDEEKE